MASQWTRDTSTLPLFDQYQQWKAKKASRQMQKFARLQTIPIKHRSKFESPILYPAREVCQARRWRLRLRLNRNAILMMTLVSLVHFKIHRALIWTMLIYIVLWLLKMFTLMQKWVLTGGGGGVLWICSLFLTEGRGVWKSPFFDSRNLRMTPNWANCQLAAKADWKTSKANEYKNKN